MMSYATASHNSATQPENRSGKVTARNLLVLAVFILTAHWALSTPKPAATTVQPQLGPGDLPNFHQVDSYLLRGAAPSPAGLQELKRLNVKTIIDLRRSQDRIAIERECANLLGIKYVSMPMGDFVPPLSLMQEYLRIVTEASQDNNQAPVFVHCSHGSDRTGFLCALWRVQHDNWSIAEAAAEMLQHGFVVHKFGPN